jgi:rhodanese-related sulfurtransferase
MSLRLVCCYPEFISEMNEQSGAFVMQIISREELKAKMDSKQPFKLVMVLGKWHFSQKRLPGSIQINTLETALETLRPDDEIVLYCTGGVCMASIQAYHTLKANGYERVRRYDGGLIEWDAAGYPLESA